MLAVHCPLLSVIQSRRKRVAGPLTNGARMNEQVRPCIAIW